MLVIHFPIALGVIAAIQDLRAHFGKRPELHRTGYTLSLWAALGGAVAMATGLQMLGDRIHTARATLHAGAGLTAGLILIVVAMVRYSAEARGSDIGTSESKPWLILEVVAVVAVVVAAVTGHRLVLGL